MRLKIILFVILCMASCSHTSKIKEISKNQILIRCHLFNMNGELIRQLPGRLCFLDKDGSYVGLFSKNSYVIKYDKKLNTLWQHKAHAHHQIKQNSEGNYIFLSSDFENYNGIQTRFDTIVMLNKENGNVMRKFSIKNYKDLIKRSQFKDTTKLHAFNWDEYHKDMAEVEYSHYNSIHEIPISFTLGNSKINKGDYIVGAASEEKILFLDSKLLKIKETLEIPGLKQIHDAQVLDNGHLLLYINSFAEDSPCYEKSMIAEYNLQEKKLIPIFDKFNARTTGGVQKLEEGNYFFSHHNETGTYAKIISKKGEIIKEIEFPFFKNSPLIQEARLGDYSENLKLNLGP